MEHLANRPYAHRWKLETLLCSGRLASLLFAPLSPPLVCCASSSLGVDARLHVLELGESGVAQVEHHVADDALRDTEIDFFV